MSELILGSEMCRAQESVPGQGYLGVEPFSCRSLPQYWPLLTLSVKMTPNFQIWYLMSMDMSLCRVERRGMARCLRVQPWPIPLPAPGLCGATPGAPGKQPRWWFRLALMVD